MSSERRKSLAYRLREFLIAHPGVWFDGRELAKHAGFYAWRTRVSNLRKRPYYMTIERRGSVIYEDGRTFKISEYCYIPKAQE